MVCVERDACRCIVLAQGEFLVVRTFYVVVMNALPFKYVMYL